MDTLYIHQEYEEQQKVWFQRRIGHEVSVVSTPRIVNTFPFTLSPNWTPGGGVRPEFPRYFSYNVARYTLENFIRSVFSPKLHSLAARCEHC